MTLGQPDKPLRGTKQLYIHTSFKVTFVNVNVTDA
jgi:hypothetical protein